MIQTIKHPCEFSDNGCQTRLKLDKIYKHEEECIYREICCPECYEDVLASELASHGECWVFKTSCKTLKKTIRLEEDWAMDVSDPDDWPTDLLFWDNRNFFVNVSPVEQGRWCFLVAMVGNVEERSKYKAKFYLKNPKSMKMEHVTVSVVSPVEALTDKTVVIQFSGSVLDKILERYIFKDLSFTMRVEIDQW